MDIFAERREEIVDDAAAAGFDLGGDRHARGDRLGVAINMQRRPIERDMGDMAGEQPDRGWTETPPP